MTQASIGSNWMTDPAPTWLKTTITTSSDVKSHFRVILAGDDPDTAARWSFKNSQGRAFFVGQESCRIINIHPTLVWHQTLRTKHLALHFDDPTKNSIECWRYNAGLSAIWNWEGEPGILLTDPVQNYPRSSNFHIVYLQIGSAGIVSRDVLCEWTMTKLWWQSHHLLPTSSQSAPSLVGTVESFRLSRLIVLQWPFLQRNNSPV